jgi:hypothetical protein
LDATTPDVTAAAMPKRDGRSRAPSSAVSVHPAVRHATTLETSNAVRPVRGRIIRSYMNDLPVVGINVEPAFDPRVTKSRRSGGKSASIFGARIRPMGHRWP